MRLRGILWGLLWLFRAGAQDGDQDFQPSFIHMSGTMVTASLTNSPADTFSLAVADNETGLLPLSDCSGRNRTDDWSLQITHQGNVSKVTVSMTRHLQLCASNATDCCVEALCLLQSLQVSACQGTKLMARLLIQAEIYANTSSGNLTGKIEADNATLIPNQVFHPLGSCPCNLTAGACDIRCCCDEDCTPEMRQLFEGSCFGGVFGGDVNPPFDQLCSAKSGILAPDWFPFLCVQSPLNNSPFLGYFYDGSTSSSRASSFELPLQTTPAKPSSGYKQGDPILTVRNDYFTVPQPFLTGSCARNAPVSFLRNIVAECPATCKEAERIGSNFAVINGGFGDNVKPEVTYEDRSSTSLVCVGEECRNVSFAEDYIVVWEGKRIKEVKIKVLYGRMCLEETVAQKFTVTFVSANATSMEGFSGNPGYQLGKPVRAANLPSSAPVTTLNLWKPVGENSCSSANLTPLLFGFNSISGCMLEVSLADNCTQLREDVAARLSSLVPVSHVGRRGNARTNASDDWVGVLRPNASSPANTSEGSLRGACPAVPAHLNIQIITAYVGAVEGIPQEEILGVQISFSTVTWLVRCALACPENGTSLPISAAVQFIKVPAQPPVPKTRFQMNYTEYDCRRNAVCWPELFYPMTRYYTGEPYPHTLAKGLVLVFFILLAVVLSGPWSGTLRWWNKP